MQLYILHISQLNDDGGTDGIETVPSIYLVQITNKLNVKVEHL